MRSDGAPRVFFGKYIDTTGRFMGILRGEYGSRLDGDACIESRAVTSSASRFGEEMEAQGRLKGLWMIDEDTGRGCFHGVWGVNCSSNL